MTQKEKAQRYDEAIEKLRSLHDDYDTVSTLIDIKEELENIFPELAESEDERVRKAMIDFFKHEREEGITVLHYGVNIERMIAWLEKQGEHANFRNKIQVGDKVTRNQDGILVNLSQLKRVAKKDEKQGEQKSIDDLSPQEAMDIAVAKCFEQGEQKSVFEMKSAEESLGIDSETYNKIVDECIYGDDDNKPAWSEEDENRINRLVAYFEDKESFTAEDDIVYANWLKSLKDRYTLKPSNR